MYILKFLMVHFLPFYFTLCFRYFGDSSSSGKIDSQKKARSCLSISQLISKLHKKKTNTSRPGLVRFVSVPGACFCQFTPVVARPCLREEPGLARDTPGPTCSVTFEWQL